MKNKQQARKLKKQLDEILRIGDQDIIDTVALLLDRLLFYAREPQSPRDNVVKFDKEKGAGDRPKEE